MAIFLGLGINGAVAQSGGAVVPATGYTATVTNPAAADAVFDSGASVLGGDRNAADITLSGTTDAGNGAIVEVRWVAFHDTTDMPTGAVGPWLEAGVAAGGAWSGTLTAPRNVYTSYRAEARVRGSTAPVGRTPDRFFVGHVMAVWGQSNPARWVGSVQAQGGITPEAIVDPTALVIYAVSRGSGTVVVKPVNAASVANGDVTAANVALANTLALARPGEKFAIAAHVASGTSPLDLMDDANTNRQWSDEVLLHDALTSNGATKVGSAWVTQWASFAAGGQNQVPVFMPIMTGKLEDGTPVSKGDAIDAGGNQFTLTHYFPDFYDLTYTRLGTVEDANDPVRVARWQAIHNDDINFPEFLVPPRPIYGVRYGRPDSAGTGWDDSSHMDTVSGYNGAVKHAKLAASDMLRMLGLLSYGEPAFTHSDFSSGTHIDVWNPDYDVTTWRNLTMGETSPFVGGFVLNTQKITTEAQLQPDAGGSGRVGVRITPASGVVDFGTLLQFAKDVPFSIINDPEDRYLERRQDLPMMIVPGAPVPALPVTPNVDFVNNIVSTTTTFVRPDPASSLLAPSGPGLGISGLTVQARVKLASGGSGTMVGQVSRGSWQIWQSGGMSISWKDSSNSNFVQSSRSDITNIAPVGVWADILMTLDLAPRPGFPNGVARIWYENSIVGTSGFIETALGPNTGQLDPGRELAIMGMDGLEVEYYRLWLAATQTNDTTALGTPDKAFTADASGNMVQTPLLPNW